MINETEFFTKIIEKYSDVNHDPVKTELLKSNAIRELMEIHSKKGKKEFIQDAMPILLSLFKDDCVDPFDVCSKDAERLSQKEKKTLNKILGQIN